MASVKIILRDERKNSEGKAPLFLRIIQNRKANYIALGIFLAPKDWNDSEKRVRKSHPNSGIYNKYIAQKIAEAEGMIISLESQEKKVKGQKIKEEIMGKEPVDFFQFAEAYQTSLEQAGKIGTADGVGSVLKKMREYLEVSSIGIDKINNEFLANYRDYLSGTLKNGTNTINANFKVIRRILNRGVVQGKLKRDDNPFNYIRLHDEPVHKEYLTEEELGKLQKAKLKKGTRMAQVRDMYLIASNCGGIRISDLLLLKWSNFTGDRLIFNILKTGQDLNIKVPDQVITILNRFKTSEAKPGDFIFPFLPLNLDLNDPKAVDVAISRATAICNKNLKLLAEKAKIRKKISTHTARHTFATRALRKGVRIEYVSKLMGHASVTETEQYAKIINEELDKAMDVFN